ncbi:MAG: acyl-CoA dehydrogenase family protein [Elusimicrobiota bacterium]|jgi:alkylation response protein AidB-like acyl-CoA dehydrogenase
MTKTSPSDQPASAVASLCAALGLGADKSLTPAAFRGAWKAFGRLGLMGLPFPRRCGGSGRSLAETVSALEALGRHAGFDGLALSVGAQMWAVGAPLLEFGSPEQRKAFLEPLCRGRAAGAPAMTEKGAGSGVLGMKTEAAAEGSGCRVTGEKTCVTNAPFADFLLVWARVAGRQGPMSLDCLIIPKGTRGLSVSPLRWELGPAGAVSGTVRLKGCVVPAGRRLGRSCQGLTVFLHAMAQERRFILAPAVGAMDKRLEETAAFARERTQSGRPIGSFQAVAHRLADMKIRLEACRALLRSAALKDAGDDAHSAAVKAFISESWVANCLDAVELHGSRGCLDAGLAAEVGAALASRLMSGTNEIQKNLIAARLGLKSA